MQRPITRFVAPTSSLQLKRLLARMRRVLGTCLALALAGHLAMMGLGGPEAEQRTAKPLTTQFVKRAPRLTKPLELKKRPRPRQRRVERQMVAVKAKAHREGPPATLQTTRVVSTLARPHVELSRLVRLDAAAVEPQAFAQPVEGSREAEDRIDMSLEMVDVDALDTGEYHAMVIQDPADKRNIKGFFHLAIAYPKSMFKREYHSGEDRVISGIIRLADRMNEWTPIRTNVSKRLSFDSGELFRTPWVHLAVHFRMEPTDEEIARLGQYMLSGGFFFGEGGHGISAPPENIPSFGYEALVGFFTQALESQGSQRGRHWLHARLPNEHPIFHCYYDFDTGPPPGNALISKFMWGAKITHPDGMEPVVRGIDLGDRLAGITTNQMYGQCWGDWGRMTIGGRYYYKDLDPDRVLQFGINTVIFALTQEGSITHRLMDSLH